MHNPALCCFEDGDKATAYNLEYRKCDVCIMKVVQQAGVVKEFESYLSRTGRLAQV